MPDSFLEQFVSFVSNNFEYIMLLNLAVLVFFVLLALALQYTEYFLPRRRHYVQKVMAFFVTVGQIAMILASGYIYWINYQRDNVIDFQARVLSSTEWVKEKVRIYFISGNDLFSINADGTGRANFFHSDDNILSYHFSPDGKSMAVVTESKLFKIRLKGRVVKEIDSVTSKTQDEFKGVIRAVSWSPDSSKFCYHISRWSKFSSLDNYYLVNAKDDSKRLIKKPNRSVDHIYWSRQGDAMYYFYTEAKDTSFYSYPYDLRLYHIGLDDLESELILTVPAESPENFRGSLEARNVNIFWETEQLSFRIEAGAASVWESSQGTRLGIDDSDHMYLMKGRLWRKRLFKIPRIDLPGDPTRYQYGGMLAVRSLRWLPGGRYAVMGYEDLGVLILDPYSGKMGQLTAIPGSAFGWIKK